MKLFLNRASAPFKVLQNGAMYAVGAVIQGFINATSGNFGVLSIFNNSIVNNFVSEAMIILRNDPAGQFAGFGTNVKPATSSDKASIVIEQKGSNFGWNIAAELRAANSSSRNVALWCPEGEAILSNAVINGRRTYETTLNNQNLNLDVSDWDMVCINPQGSGDSGVTFTGLANPGKRLLLLT
ncbi:hypothetical protein ACFFJX_09215 [Pseudarcicella hirudinis]|uniref:hypothetical protein n=1 Tax=Pseudarcicella hirudinis TaxID=1079859 RepID=UPI0035EFC78C